MAKNDHIKYAYLDQLSMEQLEALLRADLECQDESDDGVIFHILEVIEERERENPTGRLLDEAEAWSDFQKYYNIPDGTGQVLYPCELPNASGTEESELRVDSEKKIVSVYSFRWLKRCLIVAATIVVLLGSMVIAQASGIDIFGTIGRWTESTFRFVSTNEAPSPGDVSGIHLGKENPEYYDDLQAALADCGITEELIPTWYPEGFTASEPEILGNSSSDIVHISFSNSDGRFYKMDITKYHSTLDMETYTLEKDGGDVEQYTRGSRTFYIMSNLDTITAAWSDNLLLQTIGGSLSMEEIKAIIDSIGG